MRRTFDVEMEIDDAQDLTMLAYDEIWSHVLDVADLERATTDDLTRRVRVTGTLTVEDVGPGWRERKRRREERERRKGIRRHAAAEGAAVLDAPEGSA